MSATLHLEFSVDGQAQAVSAKCKIPCAGVYPRTFDLHKAEGPQELDVAIDIDLAAGILIFATTPMRLTLAGREPIEVSPQQPLIWLRDSIFACPLPADIKTIRVELLDTAAEASGLLSIRVPELARRIQPTPPAASVPAAAPVVETELQLPASSQ